MAQLDSNPCPNARVPGPYTAMSHNHEFKQITHIVNGLESSDSSRRAATGSKVNVEAFFQYTLMIENIFLVVQEPAIKQAVRHSNHIPSVLKVVLSAARETKAQRS